MFNKPVIVFEGIEGSGKSFHINNVSNFLKKKGIDHIKIREPGGSKNSEKIRKLILESKINFNKNTDLFLYLAARSENMTKLIENYKKKVILIDRFVDSTIAYQHYGLGINLSFIKKMNYFLLKNLKVDFTFINLVSEKNMIQRLKQRKKLNRYDNFKKTFYKKVQRGYLKLSKKNKKNYMLINSDLDIKINKELVITKINQLLR